VPYIDSSEDGVNRDRLEVRLVQYVSTYGLSVVYIILHIARIHPRWTDVSEVTAFLFATILCQI